MEVYVFTKEQVIDCDVLTCEPDVFKTKSDAIAEMRKWRDDEMGYVKEKGWEVEEDCDDRFCAYERGCYAENHTEFIVWRCELK